MPENVEEELRDKLVGLIESNKNLNVDLRDTRGKYQSKRVKYSEVKKRRNELYCKVGELEEAVKLSEI